GRDRHADLPGEKQRQPDGHEKYEDGDEREHPVIKDASGFPGIPHLTPFAGLTGNFLPLGGDVARNEGGYLKGAGLFVAVPYVPVVGDGIGRRLDVERPPGRGEGMAWF